MWAFTKPINLLRYLIAWRVNSSMVWHPHALTPELSLTLGTLIANRLPTTQARPWRKAMSVWDETYELTAIPTRSKKKKPHRITFKTIPNVSWPIESVLLVYPGKTTYSEGELLLWELKLTGQSADHNLFLEIILPAMEEAGQSGALNWHHKHSLWGHFDIDSVYVARGAGWEPMIQNGHLDLSYRPTPFQWSDGLTFNYASQHRFNQITWLTPFDFGETATKTQRGRRRIKTVGKKANTLQDFIEALLLRMSQFLPGKYPAPDDILALLSAEDRTALQHDLEHATRIPVHHHNLKRPFKTEAGRWIGDQTFPSIPQSLIPYLELASILHIGKQTHFGCGTFVIGDSM